MPPLPSKEDDVAEGRCCRCHWRTTLLGKKVAAVVRRWEEHCRRAETRKWFSVLGFSRTGFRGFYDCATDNWFS